MDFGPKSILRTLIPAFLGVMTLVTTGQAGQFGNNNRAVGGVMIDASGVMRTATVQELRELTDAVERGWVPVGGDLAKRAEMRMVSLRGIQNAIVKANAEGREIPSEVQ